MKRIFVFLLILSVAFQLSAESKKYYNNKKLINTMYVNSLEGLKVRDTPNLSGKRICGLVNALPVKIIEIGNETEIDGIKDNWVKILIPAYEWESENPEYGWVFGGYLSENKIKYNLNSPIDIKNLLMSKGWIDEKYSALLKTFSIDGTFEFSKLAAGGGDTGNFSVKDINTLVIKGNFYDEYGKSTEYTNTLSLKVINENRIQINGDYYVPYIDALSYPLETGNHQIIDFIYGDYEGKSIYEFIFLKNPYSHVYTEKEKKEVADKLIKYGVDASGTEYEKSYDVYWSSIIK
ncbi:MAG: SH3 domain-containing protein [Spirochaetales bacterium]|nr:SH3 domain-containing protein [Spirochaetales bacterium]